MKPLVYSQRFCYLYFNIDIQKEGYKQGIRVFPSKLHCNITKVISKVRVLLVCRNSKTAKNSHILTNSDNKDNSDKSDNSDRNNHQVREVHQV